MFVLRPPKKDEKPVAAKRRCAFDSGEKKAKKVDEKEEKEEKHAREQQEQETEDAKRRRNMPIYKPTPGPLQAWLLDGNCEQDVYDSARTYLLSWRPYRGYGKRDYKDAFKESGARYYLNPNREEESKEELGYVAYGWWSAPEEKDLLKLMDLEMVTKEYSFPSKYPSHRYLSYSSLAERKTKSRQVRQWTPLCGAEVCDALIRIVHLFLQYELDMKKKKEAEESEAALKAIGGGGGGGHKTTAADLAVKAALALAARGVDTPQQIQELKDLWNIEWTEELAAKASFEAKLGPHGGISSAGRALMCLKFGVVSVDEVKTGVYIQDSTEPRIAKPRTRHADGSVASTSKTATETPESVENSNENRWNGVFHFADGASTLGNLNGEPKDTEREFSLRSERQLSLQSEVHERETRCKSCGNEFVCQFGKCACVDNVSKVFD